MISRRKAIIGSVTVLGAISTSSEFAQAQTRSDEIVSLLGDAERLAVEALESVIGVGPVGSDPEVATKLFFESMDTARRAVRLAVEEESRVLDYVLPAQYDLALAIIDAGLSLEPSMVTELHTGAAVPPQGRVEQRSDVIADIIMQVLIGSDFSMYLQFRTALNILGLDSVLINLSKAVSDRSWATAFVLVRRILETLLSSKGRATIGSQMGQNALRQMLSSVAARFVPFIGWLLLIASIIQAIKDNWDRILNAQ